MLSEGVAEHSKGVISGVSVTNKHHSHGLSKKIYGNTP